MRCIHHGPFPSRDCFLWQIAQDQRANTKVCSLGVRACLSCLYAIPVEVDGALRTRGIRPLSATRSVGLLLSIRGVGPYSWKGSRIDIEKAAVWQHCVSCLYWFVALQPLGATSSSLTLCLESCQVLEPLGLTGRRVGDGPPLQRWHGAHRWGVLEVGHLKRQAVYRQNRSNGSNQGCPNGTHRKTGMSAFHLVR